MMGVIGRNYYCLLLVLVTTFVLCTVPILVDCDIITEDQDSVQREENNVVISSIGKADDSKDGSVLEVQQGCLGDCSDQDGNPTHRNLLRVKRSKETRLKKKRRKKADKNPSSNSFRFSNHFSNFWKDKATAKVEKSKTSSEKPSRRPESTDKTVKPTTAIKAVANKKRLQNHFSSYWEDDSFENEGKSDEVIPNSKKAPGEESSNINPPVEKTLENEKPNSKSLVNLFSNFWGESQPKTAKSKESGRKGMSPTVSKNIRKTKKNDRDSQKQKSQKNDDNDDDDRINVKKTSQKVRKKSKSKSKNLEELSDKKANSDKTDDTGAGSVSKKEKRRKLKKTKKKPSKQSKPKAKESSEKIDSSTETENSESEGQTKKTTLKDSLTSRDNDEDANQKSTEQKETTRKKVKGRKKKKNRTKDRGEKEVLDKSIADKSDSGQSSSKKEDDEISGSRKVAERGKLTRGKYGRRRNKKLKLQKKKSHKEDKQEPPEEMTDHKKVKATPVITPAKSDQKNWNLDKTVTKDKDTESSFVHFQGVKDKLNSQDKEKVKTMLEEDTKNTERNKELSNIGRKNTDGATRKPAISPLKEETNEKEIKTQSLNQNNTAGDLELRFDDNMEMGKKLTDTSNKEDFFQMLTNAEISFRKKDRRIKRKLAVLNKTTKNRFDQYISLSRKQFTTSSNSPLDIPQLKRNKSDSSLEDISNLKNMIVSLNTSALEEVIYDKPQSDDPFVGFTDMMYLTSKKNHRKVSRGRKRKNKAIKKGKKKLSLDIQDNKDAAIGKRKKKVSLKAKRNENKAIAKLKKKEDKLLRRIQRKKNKKRRKKKKLKKKSKVVEKTHTNVIKAGKEKKQEDMTDRMMSDGTQISNTLAQLDDEDFKRKKKKRNRNKKARKIGKRRRKLKRKEKTADPLVSTHSPDLQKSPRDIPYSRYSPRRYSVRRYSTRPILRRQKLKRRHRKNRKEKKKDESLLQSKSSKNKNNPSMIRRKKARPSSQQPLETTDLRVRQYGRKSFKSSLRPRLLRAKYRRPTYHQGRMVKLPRRKKKRGQFRRKNSKGSKSHTRKSLRSMSSNKKFKPKKNRSKKTSKRTLFPTHDSSMKGNTSLNSDLQVKDEESKDKGKRNKAGIYKDDPYSGRNNDDGYYRGDDDFSHEDEYGDFGTHRNGMSYEEEYPRDNRDSHRYQSRYTDHGYGRGRVSQRRRKKYYIKLYQHDSDDSDYPMQERRRDQRGYYDDYDHGRDRMTRRYPNRDDRENDDDYIYRSNRRGRDRGRYVPQNEYYGDDIRYSRRYSNSRASRRRPSHSRHSQSRRYRPQQVQRRPPTDSDWYDEQEGLSGRYARYPYRRQLTSSRRRYMTEDVEEEFRRSQRARANRKSHSRKSGREEESRYGREPSQENERRVTPSGRYLNERLPENEDRRYPSRSEYERQNRVREEDNQRAIEYQRKLERQRQLDYQRRREYQRRRQVGKIMPILREKSARIKHNLQGVVRHYTDALGKGELLYQDIFNGTRYDIMDELGGVYEGLNEARDDIYVAVMGISLTTRSVFLKARRQREAELQGQTRDEPAAVDIAKMQSMVKDRNFRHTLQKARMEHRTLERDSRHLQMMKMKYMQVKGRLQQVREYLKERYDHDTILNLFNNMRSSIENINDGVALFNGLRPLRQNKNYMNYLQKEIGIARSAVSQSKAAVRKGVKQYIANNGLFKRFKREKERKQKDRRQIQRDSPGSLAHANQLHELSRFATKGRRHSEYLNQTAQNIQRILQRPVYNAKRILHNRGKNSGSSRLNLNLFILQLKNNVKEMFMILDRLSMFVESQPKVVIPRNCKDLIEGSGAGGIGDDEDDNTNCVGRGQGETPQGGGDDDDDDFTFEENEGTETTPVPNGDPMKLYRVQLTTYTSQMISRSEFLDISAERLLGTSRDLIYQIHGNNGNNISSSKGRNVYRDVQSNLIILKRDTDEVKSTLRKISQKLQILDEIDFDELKSKAAEVIKTMKGKPDVKEPEKEEESEEKVNKTEEEKVEEKHSGYFELFRKAKDVQNGREDIKQLQTLAVNTYSKSCSKMSNIRTNISALMQKVEEAKNMLNSLQLSVSKSQDSAIPLHVPSSNSDNSNSLVTTMSICIKPKTLDGTVLYVQGNQSASYTLTLDGGELTATAYDTDNDDMDSISIDEKLKDNKWYTVKIIRAGQTFSMNVKGQDEEMVQTSKLVNEMPLLQPQFIKSYIGGVPTDAEIGGDPWQGCAGEFVLNGQSLSVFQPTLNGDQPSLCEDHCISTGQKLLWSFDGEGFVRYDWPYQESVKTIAVSFKTLQSIGTVLSVLNRRMRYHLIATLDKGALRIESSNQVWLSSNDSLNNGMVHTLKIEYHRGQVNLELDGDDGAFSLARQRPNLYSSIKEGILLGSIVSESFEFLHKSPLIGCVGNLKVNGNPKPYTDAKEIYQAHYGQCEMKSIWQSCAQLSASSVPIDFGSVENSNQISVLIGINGTGPLLLYSKKEKYEMYATMTPTGLEIMNADSESVLVKTGGDQDAMGLLTLLTIKDDGKNVIFTAFGQSTTISYAGFWSLSDTSSPHTIVVGKAKEDKDDDVGQSVTVSLSQLVIGERLYDLAKYHIPNKLETCSRQLQPIIPSVSEEKMSYCS